jgi:hypothetical protein
MHKSCCVPSVNESSGSYWASGECHIMRSSQTWWLQTGSTVNLTNRTSYVRHSGEFSSPYEVLSVVPQGSVQGPFLFNILINELCGVLKYSHCHQLADDVKMYIEIKSHFDSWLLQFDIKNFHMWSVTNFMKINANKARVIYFCWKTNLHDFDYKLCESSITSTDCIRCLGVVLDTKLHFHQ